MKFIHFSDTHIGVDTIGQIDPETGINRRVLDYLDTLDAIVEFAGDEKIDLALFTGDAFHTNRPNPIYLNEFSKRISKLSRQCPVLLLVGNHDMSRMNSASAVEIYNSLKIPNVIVGNKIEFIKIETAAGVVQIITVPYPTKELLPKNVAMKRTDTISHLLRKNVSERLLEASVGLDESLPTILAGHFSVMTAEPGIEATYFTGANAEVDLNDIFKPCFDYVALGHIHKHQNLTEGKRNVPPVVYAGSIERVSFNEEKEDKGFVLGNITNKETTWEFILTDSRPYKTLEIISEDRNVNRKMLAKISKTDIKGAVVRYIIHVPEEYSPLVDEREIQNAIMEAGAFTIGSKRIDVIRSTQKEERITGFSINMSPSELLSKYFEMKEINPKETKSLLSLGAEIMEEVNNAKK
jgi:DNA repair protein SbcD/Mre11